MYCEINENMAKQAHEINSFGDYQEGKETAEYRQQVDSCYSIVDDLPEELKEKGEQMADRYAKLLADWYNKYFRIEAMCPSVMISGAGNFPTRKKEKQNAARDRHYKEYQEIQEIPDRIRNLASHESVIKSGDENVLEKLREKLESAEKLQTEMKAQNAYYRKHKTLKGYGDYSDEKVAQIDKAISKSYFKDAPFPPYELTNNNAKIRNIRARITKIEKLKESAKESESKYNTDLFKVVENAEIIRLQLFFEDKPSTEVREILKKHGFRFAPSQNGAWQRQLTDNAKYSLKRLIEELKETKE